LQADREPVCSPLPFRPSAPSRGAGYDAMDNEPLKILLITDDEPLVGNLTAMLEPWAEVTAEPNIDAGVAMAATVNFHAVFFEIPVANAASLFRITALTERAPKLPLIIIGPVGDETYLAETVYNGAQDYLGREELSPGTLRQVVFGAIARQNQKLSLLEECENYHGIFDHLVEGIFRTTPDGHYQLANVALAKIYGYENPRQLISSIQDIAGSLYVEHSRREEFVRLMQEHDVLSGFESRVYQKTGEIIWISENCRAVRDAQGRLLYYEGTVEDITERKRAEEQIRQATAELSRSREALRRKSAVMEDNLKTAREIQLAMLPQQYPVFPPQAAPEHSAFRFAHRYEPAETVSGDFFSLSALSPTEAGFLICDVTGHGVKAALVTAMIRALSEELKPLGRDPGEFLRKLNYDLCCILKSTGTPMLTTAFYAVADCRTGRVRFANAGHPKPLLIRRATGGVEPLNNSSGRSQPALGLFEDPPYQTSEIAISPGDLLMLFTDGLYEVQGQDEELYSQERLVMDIKNLLTLPTGELFDALLSQIRAFAVSGQFDDDVCLLGVDYPGLPATNA